MKIMKVYRKCIEKLTSQTSVNSIVLFYTDTLYKLDINTLYKKYDHGSINMRKENAYMIFNARLYCGLFNACLYCKTGGF